MLFVLRSDPVAQTCTSHVGRQKHAWILDRDPENILTSQAWRKRIHFHEISPRDILIGKVSSTSMITTMEIFQQIIDMARYISLGSFFVWNLSSRHSLCIKSGQGLQTFYFFLVIYPTWKHQNPTRMRQLPRFTSVNFKAVQINMCARHDQTIFSRLFSSILAFSCLLPVSLSKTASHMSTPIHDQRAL